mgnify:CR=1 FL=1
MNTSKTVAEVQQWQRRLSINHPAIVKDGAAIFTPGKLTTGEQDADQDRKRHVFVTKMVQLEALLAETSAPAINFLTYDNHMA